MNLPSLRSQWALISSGHWRRVPRRHYSPLDLLRLAGRLGFDAAGTLAGVVFQDGGPNGYGITLTGKVAGFFGPMAGMAVGDVDGSCDGNAFG